MLSGKSVVVDDFRLENEAKRTCAMGGVIIQVVRPGVGQTSGHASESQLLAPDFVVRNEGGLEELGDRVEEVLGR